MMLLFEHWPPSGCNISIAYEVVSCTGVTLHQRALADFMLCGALHWRWAARVRACRLPRTQVEG